MSEKMCGTEAIKALVIQSSSSEFQQLSKLLDEVPGKREEIELVFAQSTGSALELLGEHSFDLLIVDISAAEEEGLDRVYGLRALSPNSPVIVLSDIKHWEEGYQAVMSGVQDFLIKEELNPSLLYKSIYYAIDSFQLKLSSEHVSLESERINRARSELLFSLADEITDPLFSIIRMTELLMGTKVTTEQKEYLHSIKNSSHQLSKVTRNLFDFSRIEAGHLQLKSEQFKVRSFIEQIIGIHSGRALLKEVSLLAECDESISERVLGDIERLGQVISNIVETSISLSRYGGQIAIKVRKNGEVDDGVVSLKFSVEIYGTELPIEKQRLIFESLAQAGASCVQKYGKMALSLAVSSLLIGLMGGKVCLDNASENGAAFHFALSFPVV